MSVSLSLIALAGSNPAQAEVKPEMPEPTTTVVAAPAEGMPEMEMPENGISIKPLVPTDLTLRQLARTETPGQSRWLTNFERAHAESLRLDVPLVVHFSAAWCGPCQKMEREVLNRPELKSLFGKEIVGVKIDGPSNEELLKRFNIVAYPTDILITTDGNVAAQRQGFQSTTNYMTLMRRLADSREIQGEYGVKEGPSASEMKPVNKDQPRSMTLEGNHQLIGLSGYSPVTLKKDRVWRKGVGKITTVFQGVTYRFVDKFELIEFQSDPENFIPGFHGCDPVQLIDESRQVPGKIQLGAIYDDRMYFFDTKAAREMFKLNPAKYAKSTRTVVAGDIDEALSCCSN